MFTGGRKYTPTIARIAPVFVHPIAKIGSPAVISQIAMRTKGRNSRLSLTGKPSMFLDPFSNQCGSRGHKKPIT